MNPQKAKDTAPTVPPKTINLSAFNLNTQRSDSPMNIANNAGNVNKLGREEPALALDKSAVDGQQIEQFLTALGYQSRDTIFYRAIGATPSNLVGSYPPTDLDLLRLKTCQLAVCGLYLVVNGGGHRDVDVKAGRAVFFEHDDMPVEKQLTLWQRFRLPEPTIQVYTGGKSIHSYWVFDSPMPVDEWRVLQADLLEWVDADRANKNPSRVMRVPGIIHHKTGNRCEIVTNSGQRYSVAEIRAIVPQQVQPEPVTQTHRESASRLHDATLNPIPLVNCLSKKHRDLIESGVGEGSRNSSGAALARDLIGAASYLDAIGQAYEPDARSLLDDFCKRCTPPLDDREADTIWLSAEKGNPTPCLTKDKIQVCINKWQREQNRKASKATATKPAIKQDADSADSADSADGADGAVSTASTNEITKTYQEIVREDFYSKTPWICLGGTLYERKHTHYQESPDEVELSRITTFLKTYITIKNNKKGAFHANPSAAKSALEWVKYCSGVTPDAINPTGALNLKNGVLVLDWSKEIPTWELEPHNPDK